MPIFTTIKIWKETRRRLRILAALRDESLAGAVDRLVREDLERLGHGEASKP